MTMHPRRIVKKTLRLDPDRLAQLQKLFQTTSASEAIRQAIDETLAYSEALRRLGVSNGVAPLHATRTSLGATA